MMICVNGIVLRIPVKYVGFENSPKMQLFFLLYHYKKTILVALYTRQLHGLSELSIKKYGVLYL